MAIFDAVMNYAAAKRYITADRRFEGKPSLKTMRRDEFTLEEYRRLHTVGRSWVKAAIRPSSTWYRTVAYNFILIMCNTGMRPSEARNLRWRDITTESATPFAMKPTMWASNTRKFCRRFRSSISTLPAMSSHDSHLAASAGRAEWYFPKGPSSSSPTWTGDYSRPSLASMKPPVACSDNKWATTPPAFLRRSPLIWRRSLRGRTGTCILSPTTRRRRRLAIKR